MTSRKWVRRIAVLGLLVVGVFAAVEVIARGRGGGRGGFSRRGPASSGSFRGNRGGGWQQRSGGRSPSSFDRARRPTPGRSRDSARAPDRQRQGDRTATRDARPSERESEGRAKRDATQAQSETDRDAAREDRQQHQQDMQQDRQDYANDVRSEREEFVEDNWSSYGEWQHDRWQFAVGTAMTIAAFQSLSCAASTRVVNGTTYYQCGGTWYTRGYQGGDVTYIVVNSPE